jgi:hypothetical protein
MICLFVFISCTMSFCGQGLGASSSLITSDTRGDPEGLNE